MLSIIAYNELNEPFNSNNILTTPQDVCVYDNVYFSINTDIDLTNKKLVWDFDYSNITKDIQIHETYNTTPIKVTFNNSYDRFVNVKVYDQVLEHLTKIKSYNKLLSNSLIQYYDNNKLFLLSATTITIFNTNTYLIENTITIPSIPTKITKYKSNYYISLSNNKIIITDTLIIIDEILMPSGVVSDMLSFNNILYVIVNGIISSSLLLIEDSTVINSIPILSNSKSLHLFNNKIYFCSLNNISVYNNNIITLIPTPSSPQYITSFNDTLYVRCNTHISIINNTTTHISVNAISNISSLYYNTSLNELYFASSNLIETLDLYTLTVTKTKSLLLNTFMFNNSTNTILTNDNTNIKFIDATTFDIFYSKQIIIPSNIIITPSTYYYFDTTSINIIKYAHTVTQNYIPNRLLEETTKNFYVYSFPDKIIGIEYAIENQIINYTTNETIYANSYQWYVNNTLLSSNNIFTLTYNYVVANIELRISHGYNNKILKYQTKLSLGSAVLGTVYDEVITDKLLFFNKEGDNLNFELVKTDTDTYWEGELMFDENSSDTFKTIGLYVLENVEPVSLDSNSTILRKMQLFSEFGMDFEKGNDVFYIDKIENVNNKNGFYSKWIYSTNIDKVLSVGNEIYLTDVYECNIDNSIQDNPILLSYNIDNEFNSLPFTTINLYTVLDKKQNAVMVFTNTLNSIYVSKYNYGTFRQSNNVLKTIPQGKIISLNLIKIYNDSFNTEWNESDYKNLLYDNKKISIVNSKSNDGIYTVNYANAIDSKNIKKRIYDLSVFTETDNIKFDLKLTLKTNKIFLGKNNVTFLPYSNNPYLNTKSILVWDSTPKVDYTPKLLKPNTVFKFEQTISFVNNFIYDYTVVEKNVAKKILNYNSTDKKGVKIVLIDNDGLKDCLLNITSNKTVYRIIEGVNWNVGSSLNESSYNLAYYIGNNVVGVTVLYLNNEVWIYEKEYYTLQYEKTGALSLEYNVLNMNNPEYGIINNEWVLLNEEHSGYVHYRVDLDIFYILYYSNSVKSWYTLPANKIIVNTTQLANIDYLNNVLCECYINDNTITLNQVLSKKNDAIYQFVNTNKTFLKTIGLNIDYNNKLSITNMYPIVLDDYIEVELIINDSVMVYPIENMAIDFINTKESLVNEKNIVISENFKRKILFNSINSFGLNLNINGIDYFTNFSNVNNMTNVISEQNILDTEQTLLNFGNELLNGKKYNEILEYQGVMVWLESSNATINNVKHYDTIVIESKFPNVPINYKVNAFDYKIFHSSVEFIDINEITITINRKNYTTPFLNNIISTVNEWVSTYYDSLILEGVYVVSKNESIYFYTLDEKTIVNYKVWVGKNSTSTPFYKITNYKNGNNSVILSGNEIYNPLVNFEDIGFSTAMLLSVKNSEFEYNNKEYNVIYTNPNNMGLSYQGAFWGYFDQIGYIKNRSNFDWSIYSTEITNTIDTVTYFNDELSQKKITYDVFNKNTWVLHDSNIVVYDLDYLPINNILITNAKDIIFNIINNNTYIISGNSMLEIKDFSITNTIVVGNSPVKLLLDTYYNYLYVLNEYDDLNVIDLNTFQSIQLISIGDTPKDILSYGRLLYVTCYDSNLVYTINMDNFTVTTKTILTPLNINIINNIPYITNAINVTRLSDLSVITTNTNPTLIINDGKNLYVVCNDKIDVIYNESVIYTITTSSNILDIKFIESCNKVCFVLIDKIGFINKDDEFFQVQYFTSFYNLKNIYLSNLVLITTDTVNIMKINIINDVVIEPSPNIELSTRQFLRYPREQYNTEKPIYFKTSWEKENDSFFFYDFSGTQLYVKIDDKLVNDYNSLNYTGSIPLIIDNNVILNKKYNTDINLINSPKHQQTVFNELYHQLNFIDSEYNLETTPYPIQLFIGYNSVNEGVHNNSLTIQRIENISLNIETKLIGNSYTDVLEFNNNDITLTNSNINFIDSGIKKGQKIELSGFESSKKNKSIFGNSGIIGIVEKVTVNTIRIKPLNKMMVNESSISTTTSYLPPFKTTSTTLNITITVLPSTIAKIKIIGQTEIEDERFKVMLDNFGHNINFRDAYIFKEYDIKEFGIDWIFLNNKRKEMLINGHEIYNYLGSYKALINAVNYFGYNDLEVYEYYLNVDKNSDKFNKLYKVEVIDIFNPLVKGYTTSDFVSKQLPNKTYNKTKLFNLTYRITDLEGNYVLGYSLEEVITKLVGLKKWLRNNIMPVGTRITDLTGRGDTVASTTLWHDVKKCTVIKCNESLTVIEFKATAYLQPIENNSKTYNVLLEFSTTDSIKEFQVNINTYSNDNIMVQKLSYYKTNFNSINFAIDYNIDPMVKIETICDNGYGGTYKNIKQLKIN